MMQALILAAGMGKRLGKLTNSDTKCMLEVNGVKLIDRAIDALEAAEIKKLCIVIGYKGNRVQEYLGKRRGSVEIAYVENPDFATTNNIYSLLLASDFLKEDDTILLESDLIFEPAVISELVNDTRENIVVVDKFQSWMDGTIISFNEKGIVDKFFSKKNQENLELRDFYKTVNIYKFSSKFSKKTYIPFLESYCKSIGLNEYYESVLSTIAHLKQENLFAKEIAPYLWHEIDDVIDHANAETMFANDGELHQAYSNRYGGYWRFPKIKDFCYLVNPYFPTSNFQNVLKEEFSTLLSEYPSGLKVNELMAANLYKIDPKYLTVGNGASELICALGESLPKSTIGYFNPSFDEYATRLEAHTLEFVDAFNLNADQVLNEIKNLSIKCNFVILVNPDNPTGRFIDPQRILNLLPVLKENSCTLILDESFVDFSTLFETGTLISDDILQKNQNLIIVKSISKSYGVAGVRLGVIATSNQTLLEKIRKKLPVWNINSFAEKFLQKITYFQNEYWASCRKVSEERSKFSNEIVNCNVKVWESSANFLMIELSNSIDINHFCNFMIKNGILVKSLVGKKGMPHGNFLRIAIKSEADNYIFLEALRQYEFSFT